MSLARRTLAVLCLSLLAVACSPKHQDSQQQNAGAGATENAPRIGIACAGEIQKYCANDPRKRRCLRDNMDKLGDACKVAVNAPHNPRGIGRMCSGDIQKFCANDQHKMRCLRDNLAQLSDACKTAVSAPRNPQPANAQPANDNP
jgi:hypothetical protein